MRRAAKVDLNHGQIVDAFRASGALVLSLAPMGRGVPDLLVAHRGALRLVEVKNGRGGLTHDQENWHALGWPVTVVRSTGDVDAALRST